MIYSTDNIIHERNTGEVKLSVAFERFKKWFKGEEMDTKKIDKMIHQIEECNRKIAKYKTAGKNEKNKIRKELESNKEVVARELREMFWIIPASVAMGWGGIINPILGGIIVGLYTMLVNERLTVDSFYKRIEDENNKALEWLKEERDVIRFKKSRKESNKEEQPSDEVNTESTIFESVEFV
jgi:hypothetical protein